MHLFWGGDKGCLSGVGKGSFRSEADINTRSSSGPLAQRPNREYVGFGADSLTRGLPKPLGIAYG